MQSTKECKYIISERLELWPLHVNRRYLASYIGELLESDGNS